VFEVGRPAMSPVGVVGARNPSDLVLPDRRSGLRPDAEGKMRWSWMEA
jgi:hypothetical protein